MARLDQERKNQLEPERMNYAISKLEDLGFDVRIVDDTEIQFEFNSKIVKFFPYSGWHTGSSIKDGRGLDKLIKQIS